MMNTGESLEGILYISRRFEESFFPGNVTAMIYLYFDPMTVQCLVISTEFVYDIDMFDIIIELHIIYYILYMLKYR